MPNCSLNVFAKAVNFFSLVLPIHQKSLISKFDTTLFGCVINFPNEFNATAVRKGGREGD